MGGPSHLEKIQPDQEHPRSKVNGRGTITQSPPSSAIGSKKIESDTRPSEGTTGPRAPAAIFGFSQALLSIFEISFERSIDYKGESRDRHLFRQRRIRLR